MSLSYNRHVKLKAHRPDLAWNGFRSGLQGCPWDGKGLALPSWPRPQRTTIRLGPAPGHMNRRQGAHGGWWCPGSSCSSLDSLPLIGCQRQPAGCEPRIFNKPCLALAHLQLTCVLQPGHHLPRHASPCPYSTISTSSDEQPHQLWWATLTPDPASLMSNGSLAAPHHTPQPFTLLPPVIAFTADDLVHPTTITARSCEQAGHTHPAITT